MSTKRAGFFSLVVRDSLLGGRLDFSGDHLHDLGDSGAAPRRTVQRHPCSKRAIVTEFAHGRLQMV